MEDLAKAIGLVVLSPALIPLAMLKWGIDQAKKSQVRSGWNRSYNTCESIKGYGHRWVGNPDIHSYCSECGWGEYEF